MCIQGEDVLILFSAETPTATKKLICTLTCTLEPFTRVRACREVAFLYPAY